MVKQRRATDCGIATLANAIGIKYEDALHLFGEDRAVQGVTIQHTASVLFSLGYQPVYVAFDGFTQVSGIPVTPAFPQALQCQQAILEVLTPSGLVHQVYFDGHHVIDPSPEITGAKQLSEYVLVDAVFVSKPGSVVRKREAGCSVCDADRAVVSFIGSSTEGVAGL